MLHIKWVLRRMVQDDVPLVDALARACGVHSGGALAFATELDRPFARCFVATEPGDGHLVGYATAWLVAGECQILSVAVAPDSRRTGVGARLVQQLLRCAEAEGCLVATLEVRQQNAAARQLYASQGFQIDGLRNGYYARPPDDAVLMSRQLSGGTGQVVRHGGAPSMSKAE